MLHRNIVYVIHPQDEMFDPRQPGAEGIEAEGADGMVVSVLQKGYRMLYRVQASAGRRIQGEEREATDTVNPTLGLA
ncbi:hypothetical protein [Candidatus Tremblaya princeps]|uniref:hypothetical protein n=1 Tax=Tremblaya princeps TaxID=189385 RepID=UPI00094652CA